MKVYCMDGIREKIKNISSECIKALESSSSLEALEVLRVAFLGRKGKIADLMPQLSSLSIEQKRDIGPLINDLKKNLDYIFEQKKQKLIDMSLKEKEEVFKNFDVTAYTPGRMEGSLHPYTHVTQILMNIFSSLGFEICDGPEVEIDFYNFTALNIPENHPARDMQDTFWLNIPGLLLRTQTSNVQIHSMQKYKNMPLAIASMGRVYRNEATDASHDYMFQQCEGMFIDKHVSMAHLIGTLKLFLQTLFDNKKIKLRVRPGYFPFVEPGIEVDASCPFCTKGCSTCKQTKWIEMGGAGLIHPQVLLAGKIDPKKYQGFAFGFGLTRMVMLKYGISDIRLLHSCNVEFLKQF